MNYEDMKRGQAERLMFVIEGALTKANKTLDDVDVIAVGVGPGNFTGIRISVATARGMSLGLNIPAVGVSMFEVTRDPSAQFVGPSEIVSLPAPRDRAYVQHFRNGLATDAPVLFDFSAPDPELKFLTGTIVIGHRAEEISKLGDTSAETLNEQTSLSPDEIAKRIAHRAAALIARDDFEFSRPSPLYVAAPDAAPPRDPAPRILT